ncbi:hypothetical protein, partial [Thioclava sp. JM3]|uniref:hypothetical protein n=1 Tax=Thioclava sp. JM3 TaxID=1973004 RepID=UPI00198192EE
MAKPSHSTLLSLAASIGPQAVNMPPLSPPIHPRCNMSRSRHHNKHHYRSLFLSDFHLGSR